MDCDSVEILPTENVLTTEEKLDKAERLIKDFEAKLTVLVNELKHYKTSCGELEKENNRLQARVDKLESENATLS